MAAAEMIVGVEAIRAAGGGGGGTEDDSADDGIAHIPKSLSLPTGAAETADDPDEMPLPGTETEFDDSRVDDDTAENATDGDGAFDGGDIGPIIRAEFDFLPTEFNFLPSEFAFRSAEFAAGGPKKSSSATRRTRAR